MSEDTGGFLHQDSDLEYLFWQCKNPPVSSDIKPPLICEVGCFSNAVSKIQIEQVEKTPKNYPLLVSQKAADFTYYLSS